MASRKGNIFSKKYGDQPHPIHKNLVVHNSGIEISTEKGASARAVLQVEKFSKFR